MARSSFSLFWLIMEGWNYKGCSFTGWLLHCLSESTVWGGGNGEAVDSLGKAWRGWKPCCIRIKLACYRGGGKKHPWNSWSKSPSQSGCRARWSGLVWQLYIFFNLNENMLLFGGKKIIVTNSAANKCNENVVLNLRSSQPTSDSGIIGSMDRGGSKSRMGGIRSFFLWLLEPSRNTEKNCW